MKESSCSLGRHKTLKEDEAWHAMPWNLSRKTVSCAPASLQEETARDAVFLTNSCVFCCCIRSSFSLLRETPITFTVKRECETNAYPAAKRESWCLALRRSPAGYWVSQSLSLRQSSRQRIISLDEKVSKIQSEISNWILKRQEDLQEISEVLERPAISFKLNRMLNNTIKHHRNNNCCSTSDGDSNTVFHCYSSCCSTSTKTAAPDFPSMMSIITVTSASPVSQTTNLRTTTCQARSRDLSLRRESHSNSPLTSKGDLNSSLPVILNRCCRASRRPHAMRTLLLVISLCLLSSCQGNDEVPTPIGKCDSGRMTVTIPTHAIPFKGIIHARGFRNNAACFANSSSTSFAPPSLTLNMLSLPGDDDYCGIISLKVMSGVKVVV